MINILLDEEIGGGERIRTSRRRPPGPKAADYNPTTIK
jgi:hypothetical protein